jgi:hypothetical protein
LLSGLVGLQVDRQERVGNLTGDARDVEVVPELEAGLPFGQFGVGDSAHFGFFTQAQDSADGLFARLVVVAPIGGRFVARGGNPAAIDQDGAAISEDERGDEVIPKNQIVVAGCAGRPGFRNHRRQ